MRHIDQPARVTFGEAGEVYLNGVRIGWIAQERRAHVLRFAHHPQLGQCVFGRYDSRDAAREAATVTLARRVVA